MRPWRLATENSNLFHPAKLMREEEERRREKVLQAAGVFLGGDGKAPIANLSHMNSSVDTRASRQRGEGPAAAPPKGEGATAMSHQVDAAGEQPSGDGLNRSRATFSGQNAESSGLGREEEGGTAGPGYGEEDAVVEGGGASSGPTVWGLPNFDVESDVQKRVLDLVSLHFYYVVPEEAKFGNGVPSTATTSVLISHGGGAGGIRRKSVPGRCRARDRVLTRCWPDVLRNNNNRVYNNNHC